MERDKRLLRKLKRVIKQAGNKKRRQQMKRDLRENPDEAHWSEPPVGKSSSATLNGIDQDATRKRTVESTKEPRTQRGRCPQPNGGN